MRVVEVTYESIELPSVSASDPISRRTSTADSQCLDSIKAAPKRNVYSRRTMKVCADVDKQVPNHSIEQAFVVPRANSIILPSRMICLNNLASTENSADRFALLHSASEPQKQKP